MEKETQKPETDKIRVGLGVYIKIAILISFILSFVFSIFIVISGSNIFFFKPRVIFFNFTLPVSVFILFVGLFFSIAYTMKKKPTENKIEDDKGDKKDEGKEKKDKEEKAKDKKKTDAEQLDKYLKSRYKGKSSETGCLGWIIIFLAILLSYMVWQNWDTLLDKFSKKLTEDAPVETVQQTPIVTHRQNWKLYMVNTSSDKRNECFNIRFTRLNDNTMEFSVLSNVRPGVEITRFNLRRRNTNWQWQGRYANTHIRNSGFARFNEKIVDNHIEYIGEQSVDETCAEWVYTVLKPD